MTRRGINNFIETGNYEFIQPQSHQNLSETSSPTKYQRWYSVLPTSDSLLSSVHHDPSLGSQTDHNLNDSQNLQILLEQATNIRVIDAYEGGRRLKRLKENIRMQVFEAEVKHAMLLNKNYQFKQALIFLAKAEVEKERIPLDEWTAHGFLLYYVVKGRVLLYENYEKISKESFDKCLEAFTEAESIAKRYFKNDSKCLSEIRNNIAKLHYTSKHGNRQRAKELLQKSLRFSEATKDLEHKALCYFQLAELYQIFKRPNKVRENLRLCRETASKLRNRKSRFFFLARTKRNEGLLHFSLGEEIQGEDCYQKSLRQLRKIFPHPNILIDLYSKEWKELELGSASEISLE